MKTSSMGQESRVVSLEMWLTIIIIIIIGRLPGIYDSDSCVVIDSDSEFLLSSQAHTKKKGQKTHQNTPGTELQPAGLAATHPPATATHKQQQHFYIYTTDTHDKT